MLVLKDNFQTAVLIILEVYISVFTILNLNGLGAGILGIAFGSLGLCDDVEAFF